MNAYHDALTNRYRQRGIMIDTNLLLMLIVGDMDTTTMRAFKRTQGFTPQDYRTLQEIVVRFDRQMTTAHILTEVSNLGGQLAEGLKEAFTIAFRTQVESMEEIPIEAKRIIDISMFGRFGLTDTGIYLGSKDRYLVITTDAPLYHYLIGNGVDVINFNHLLTP
jgi:rRNA-processing protein FCF1